MPILKLENATINYETSGSEGSWVCLVNGHMRSLKDFRMLTKKLLTHGYRVVSIDNRGSGESSYNKAFTLEDMALDLVSLLDHLQIETTHLLGISMGGAISQLVCSKIPKRILSLILVSTCAHNQWLTKQEAWGHELFDIENKLSSYVHPDFLSRNKLLIQAMAKQMAKQLDNSNYREASHIQRANMDSLDQKNICRTITTPSLIIHGEDDRIIQLEASYELHHLIENSKISIFSNAGHLLLAETPENLYKEIIEWLQTN